MAAVIRLKRRLEDEPSDKLILNCKKRKTDDGEQISQPEISTILKFAGTIDNQDETLTKLKKTATKTELQEQFKTHPVDLYAKLKFQAQEDSKKNRYKVVNCFRTNNNSELPEESTEAEYTIYDLETDSHENEPSSSDSNTQYVYDLYYTPSDDFGDDVEDYVNMYPYNDALIHGSMRDNGQNQPDSDNESEDSNAENNWKNDYPDEHDFESVSDDDMIEAMKRCDLDDLSSDEGEEGFMYSVDSEAAGFEDVDDDDVQRYGERYARFKANIKKVEKASDLDSGLYYGDIDEEENYY